MTAQSKLESHTAILREYVECYKEDPETNTISEAFNVVYYSRLLEDAIYDQSRSSIDRIIGASEVLHHEVESRDKNVKPDPKQAEAVRMLEEAYERQRQAEIMILDARKKRDERMEGLTRQFLAPNHSRTGYRGLLASSVPAETKYKEEERAYEAGKIAWDDALKKYEKVRSTPMSSLKKWLA